MRALNVQWLPQCLRKNRNKRRKKKNLKFMIEFQNLSLLSSVSLSAWLKILLIKVTLTSNSIPLCWGTSFHWWGTVVKYLTNNKLKNLKTCLQVWQEILEAVIWGPPLPRCHLHTCLSIAVYFWPIETLSLYLVPVFLRVYLGSPRKVETLTITTRVENDQCQIIKLDNNVIKICINGGF